MRHQAEAGTDSACVQIPGRPPGAAAGPAPPGVKEVPPGEAIPDPACDPDLVQIGTVRLPCKVCAAPAKAPPYLILGCCNMPRMCLVYVLLRPP